jgi:hypothetical protein
MSGLVHFNIIHRSYENRDALEPKPLAPSLQVSKPFALRFFTTDHGNRFAFKCLKDPIKRSRQQAVCVDEKRPAGWEHLVDVKLSLKPNAKVTVTDIDELNPRGFSDIAWKAMLSICSNVQGQLAIGVPDSE